MTIAEQTIHAIVSMYPQLEGMLSKPAKRLYTKAKGYPSIRRAYRAEVYQDVYGYLTDNRPITSFRNAMQNAMQEAFLDAAEVGYVDGGGTLPMEDDDGQWLNDKMHEELDFIGQLFDRLKAEWENIDPRAEANARADGYAATLDSIYSEAMLRGSKNIMVTWRFGETEAHCPTCTKLNGQRHKISWFLDKGYIPGEQGSETLSCHGYNCDCYLENDKGDRITLEK